MAIQPVIPIPLRLTDETTVREFINAVHKKHGIVIALSWRLKPKDVIQLTTDGVDGFEIANTSHPVLLNNTRKALLTLSHNHQGVLVADSDWHGWGGFLHTWTLIKANNVITRNNAATLLLNTIRQHDDRDVIAAVANPIGRPSLGRAIFAPFVEAFRYAQELSSPRLISLGIWTLLIAWVCSRLKQAGFSPGICFGASAFFFLGCGLIIRVIMILWDWRANGSLYIFPWHMGCIALGIGGGAIITGILLSYKAIKRRQLTAAPIYKVVSRKLSI